MPYAKKKQSKPKRTYKRKTYSKKPTKTYVPKPRTNTSGFDEAIYKTDRILGQVGHGFDVLSKPVSAVFNAFKKTFVDVIPEYLFRSQIPK